VAERLIGKGYELRIFDPEVNLSRLIGANKRFIEESIPHIGSLMVSSCDEALAHGQLVLVGVGGKSIVAAVLRGIQPHHRVVDLIGLPRDSVQCADYSGVCWR